MPILRRREFITQSGTAACGLVMAGRSAGAVPGYADQYPDMLLSHVAGKLNKLAKHWDEERARMNSREAVETRNRFVREKSREMIHGLPERTPLKPVTTATHERDGYRIENIMFQSRPD